LVSRIRVAPAQSREKTLVTDLELAEEVQQLVRLIRGAKTAERILRLHHPDSSGHCPVCPAGGASSGHVVSPCSLWLAAAAARRRG
jgi:hypothetical protein